MTCMEFRATHEFLSAYRVVADAAVACVDDALERVLVDPSGAWARQSRVEGDKGGAWIVVVRCSGVDYHIYWRDSSDGRVEFLLLISR
jgi:hypothetical protein